jgi:hypothetical protein
MTCWQKGDKDAARQWFDRATERGSKSTPDQRGPDPLRAEAAQLLGVDIPRTGS